MEKAADGGKRCMSGYSNFGPRFGGKDTVATNTDDMNTNTDRGGSEPLRAGEGRGGLDWREASPTKWKPLPVYELYGICNHMGSLEGGHYTAQCRASPSMEASEARREWNNFDDARICETDAAKIRGNAAYVLFYRLAGNTRPARKEYMVACT